MKLKIIRNQHLNTYLLLNSYYHPHDKQGLIYSLKPSISVGIIFKNNIFCHQLSQLQVTVKTSYKGPVAKYGAIFHQNKIAII